MGAEIWRETATPSRPRIPKHDKPDHLTVKTYVVLQRVFSADRDRPNVRVLDVKLNLAAAEAIRDQHTGTWIERILADKRLILTER